MSLFWQATVLLRAVLIVVHSSDSSSVSPWVISMLYDKVLLRSQHDELSHGKGKEKELPCADSIGASLRSTY